MNIATEDNQNDLRKLARLKHEHRYYGLLTRQIGREIDALELRTGVVIPFPVSRTKYKGEL